MKVNMDTVPAPIELRQQVGRGACLPQLVGVEPRSCVVFSNTLGLPSLQSGVPTDNHLQGHGDLECDRTNKPSNMVFIRFSGCLSGAGLLKISLQ